jgi:hypothetical protein
MRACTRGYECGKLYSRTAAPLGVGGAGGFLAPYRTRRTAAKGGRWAAPGAPQRKPGVRRARWPWGGVPGPGEVAWEATGAVQGSSPRGWWPHTTYTNQVLAKKPGAARSKAARLHK